MVIALFIGLVWVGGVEAQPSAIKSGAVPPRNEGTEVFNGSLQSREVGLEKEVNIARPIRDSGINGSKLCQNDGTKDATSCGAASFVTGTPSKVSAEASHKDGAEDTIGVGEKSFEHFFYVCLYLFIVLMPIWLQMFGIYDTPPLKPNAEVRRLPPHETNKEQ